MLLSELLEQGSEVAIIFGRYNPPHKGHKAAWEVAAQSPIWYVGTNKSTLGPKDPLPYEVKIEAMKAIWPEVGPHIINNQRWLTLCSRVFEEHGNVNLVIVTEENWVLDTIKKYNGVEGKTHGFYKFSNIILKTSPRLSSATDLRNAVEAGNRDAFSKAAGISADTLVAGMPYFDLVAKYLLPYATKMPTKKVSKK